MNHYTTLELAFAAFSAMVLIAFISFYPSMDDVESDSGCGCCLSIILLCASIIDLVYFFGKTCVLITRFQ